MFKSSWMCSALLLVAGLLPRRKRRPQRRRPRWARPCIESLEDRCLLSVTINEFPDPGPGSGPDYMHAGPDGNVWFLDANFDFLGRVTPAGEITEFSPARGIVNFAFGKDGNIWVGCDTHIAEVTTQGTLLHDYVIPSTLAYPYHALNLTVGPDDNIWYTEGYASGELIGRMTPDGQITEFPIPFHGAEITTGPDGNLWFDAVDQETIGRITPTGDVTIFSHPDNDPSNTFAIRVLTSGPNGNLWMETNQNGRIIEVNTAGQLVTTFSDPTARTL